LPDLYDKYRPKPIENMNFNSSRELTPTDADVNGRTRSGFRRNKDNNTRQSTSFQDLRDLESKNKDSMHNKSMIEEYQNKRLNHESSSVTQTPDRSIISGLKDYYSDTKSNYYYYPEDYTQRLL